MLPCRTVASHESCTISSLQSSSMAPGLRTIRGRPPVPSRTGVRRSPRAGIHAAVAQGCPQRRLRRRHRGLRWQRRQPRDPRSVASGPEERGKETTRAVVAPIDGLRAGLGDAPLPEWPRGQCPIIGPPRRSEGHGLAEAGKGKGERGASLVGLVPSLPLSSASALVPCVGFTIYCLDLMTYPYQPFTGNRLKQLQVEAQQDRKIVGGQLAWR